MKWASCRIPAQSRKTLEKCGACGLIEAAKRKLIHGDDGSWRSGDVIQKYSFTANIPQPLGHDEQFTFYVCSYDPDKFIEISLPAFAFVSADDINKKAKVDLRITATLGNPLPIMPTRRISLTWAFRAWMAGIGTSPPFL